MLSVGKYTTTVIHPWRHGPLSLQRDENIRISGAHALTAALQCLRVLPSPGIFRRLKVVPAAEKGISAVCRE